MLVVLKVIRQNSKIKIIIIIINNYDSSNNNEYNTKYQYCLSNLYAFFNMGKSVHSVDQLMILLLKWI